MDTATKLIGKTIQSAELFRESGKVILNFTDNSKFEVDTNKNSTLLFGQPTELIQFKAQNKEEHFLVLQYLKSLGYHQTVGNFGFEFPVIVIRLKNKELGGNYSYWEYRKLNVYNTDSLEDLLKLINEYHGIKYDEFPS